MITAGTFPRRYAATCDAHHITTPHPEGAGLSDCLARALDDAGVPPTDVGYINAHGTSTAYVEIAVYRSLAARLTYDGGHFLPHRYNDKFETMAIKQVFGAHAHELRVSSTKSMTGHTLGAAGGIEAVRAVARLPWRYAEAPPLRLPRTNS